MMINIGWEGSSPGTGGRDAAGATAYDAKEPTANEWRQLVRRSRRCGRQDGP